MALPDGVSERWMGLRRYWSRRVLAGWLVLSLLITGYVYATVTHVIPYGPLLFGFLLVTPVVYGVLLTVFGGTALAIWSHRPVIALGGAVFVGLAALSVSAGCPGVGCAGVERFRVFFEWTALGPTISASSDAGRCAFLCPHTVELVPLAIGYLLVGEAILRGS